MSGEHALYAPSSMAQTLQCPASVGLQRRYPEEDGESAIEGTAAHWAMAELCARRPVAVGQITPGGVALDDDMIEAAELFASVVRPDQPGLMVEHRVHMPDIHRDCWGTLDAARWAGFQRCSLYDFKYGHDYVDEFENPQLMAYANGLLREARLEYAADAIFDLTIIQPRCYGRKPVRTWSVTVGELRAHWNLMRTVCEEADGEQSRTIAGPACRHCSARHACDSLQRATLSVLDAAGQREPLELNTAAAAAELRRMRYAMELMTARSTGLEQQLMSAARSGQQVPGFHIENGAGRERWSVPVDQVLQLGTMYGRDLRKPSTLTPAQARDAGVATDGFTERKGGEARLVVDQPHRMVRIFKGIGQ